MPTSVTVFLGETLTRLGLDRFDMYIYYFNANTKLVSNLVIDELLTARPACGWTLLMLGSESLSMTSSL